MHPVAGLRGTAVVTRSGAAAAEVAGGRADIEAGVPCGAATRFQLCSVSKQFTAAAVMLLAESGRLDLQEPVTRWLPGSPPPWRQITLHHLLPPPPRPPRVVSGRGPGPGPSRCRSATGSP